MSARGGNAKLNQAIECNAQGRLDDAEKHCRSILRTQSKDSTALHLLGVVLCRKGRFAEGEIQLRRAVAAQPREPEIWRHLGDAQHSIGKYMESVASFRRLVALAPDDARGYLGLGISLLAGGLAEDAVEACAQALVREKNLPLGYFNLAAALHQAGRLDEAAAAYARAVEQSPSHAEAVLNLGNVLSDQQRWADARAVYLHALSLRPDWPEAMTNAGLAAQAAGDLTEAESWQRKAVAADPRYVPGWTNLGGTLQRLGHHDGAVRAFQQAAALDSDDPLVLSNLAQALDEQGGAEADGLALHQQAVAADPFNGVARYNLAVALRSTGRLTESVTQFRKVIEVAPNLDDALLGLGSALFDLDDYSAAADSFAEALHRRPSWPEALTNAGLTAKQQGFLDHALILCRRAVECRPDYAVGWTNLGGVLERLNRQDEALAAFETAAKLAPEAEAALPNLAQGLDQVGRDDEALALHRQAVARYPDCAIAHFNMGVALLRRGEFREGWREYQWRWRGGVPKFETRDFGRPEWQGEDIAGSTLLVHAEQGFGDTLQFVRFLRKATERCARVILEVQPALMGLLGQLSGVVDVVTARGQDLPPFDLHIPLMNLPGVLDLPPSEWGELVPYLRADDCKQAQWSHRLRGTARRKVGLVWSGNPSHRADLQRSIPAAVMLGHLTASPVTLFSLQKDVRESDRAVLARYAGQVVDLAADLIDFNDTAAALAEMDLVITVDTAVAHLAGAMGRPVWLLVASPAEWRWMREREDTPWYPNMRLFRQERRGDWDGVLARVAAALV